VRTYSLHRAGAARRRRRTSEYICTWGLFVYGQESGVKIKKLKNVEIARRGGGRAGRGGEEGGRGRGGAEEEQGRSRGGGAEERIKKLNVFIN